ncbi:MAG TPA: hypothetical protein VN976_11805 [Verrucomicrobiae bacterium]|nr:hypothetical protein [Verrucomicrobiae bacterium]
MTQKFLWRGALIVALCMILAIPTQADQLGDDARNAVIGIVAVAVALVVITVVIVHESRKKRTVTGCVTSGANGMSVTDEKDKRIYALSGNTADIKPGDRFTLHGKKVNPKGASAPLTWQVNTETKDLGACQP